MRKALILFVLCLASVSAEPLTASSLLLDVSMEAGYTLDKDSQDARVDYVTAKYYFFPKDTYYQDIISIETIPKASLTDDYYEFNWENPSFGEHYFTLDSRIRTFNRYRQIPKKVDFPAEVEQEYFEYLEPSEKIDITEDIIAQASELAEGEDDFFKVVFSLASWTKENIHYELDTITADASQKASWVLANRRGVCDELTNLFIAMCRSLGIPARFVSGLSYSNSELFEQEWGLHGWAEVYFPHFGWVAFDPTYGQYGNLDATHIKLGDSTDSDKSSTRFEYSVVKADLFPIKLDTDVKILEEESALRDIIDIEIEPFSSKVDFGSYNLIEAKLRNLEDYYVGFELNLVKPDEVEIIDGAGRYVVLEPNEQKSVYWIAKVDEALSKRYIYTFPIEAVNSLGSSEDGSFRSESGSINYDYSQILRLYGQLKEEEEKTYSKNIDIQCDAPLSVYENKSFNFSCTVKNTGNVYISNLKVCNDDCHKADLGIAQSKRFWFADTLIGIGEQEITIKASGLDVSKIQQVRIKVEDKPKITLENIHYPEEVEFGPEFEISFELFKKSIGDPQNMTVFFYFNGKRTDWDVGNLDSNRKFSVNADKSVLFPGNNTFKIEVEYYDRLGIKYTEVFEHGLSVENPGLWEHIQMWMNKLSREIEILLGW